MDRDKKVIQELKMYVGNTQERKEKMDRKKLDAVRGHNSFLFFSRFLSGLFLLSCSMEVLYLC